MTPFAIDDVMYDSHEIVHFLSSYVLSYDTESKLIFTN